jgi:hypothetical protein
MNPEEAPGGLEDGIHRLDPVPVPGECVKALECLGCRLRREVALPLETRDGRSTLDGSSPPGDHPRIAKQEIPYGNRGLLLD